MAPVILTLNAGSSSLKFALFRGTGPALLRGLVEGLETGATITLHGSQPPSFALPDLAGQPYEAVLAALLDALNRSLAEEKIGAVGHRIVHGGQRFVTPVRIDPEVLVALDSLIPLAPLHQPHNLAAIHAIAKAYPGLPQVGCFDTAFHRTLPAVATRLALPGDLGDAARRGSGGHAVSPLRPAWSLRHQR